MISSNSSRLSMISHHIAMNQFSTQTKTINNIDIISNNLMAKLLLNKPKALNSLSTQMVLDITSQLEYLNTHKAIWLQGAGGKAFCAGGDVKALFVDGANQKDRINFFKNQFELDYKLTQSKGLRIANWDGIVMGGGVGISAFSDYIIATQNSMYAMPQGKIGFFTDVGAGYFLSRLRNNIGYYLGLTGARLKGQDVYRAGLANYYIPRENIQKAYQQINSSLKNQRQNNKKIIHQVLLKYHKPSQKKFLDNEQSIKEIFSKTTVKQIYQTVKSSSNPFYQSIYKMLQQQCPLSVHVTHKSIKISEKRSIKQCFVQDFILAQHYSTNQNFSQGVRCLLIDKGDTPKWTHKNILDIQQEYVKNMFKEPSNPVYLDI